MPGGVARAGEGKVGEGIAAALSFKKGVDVLILVASWRGLLRTLLQKLLLPPLQPWLSITAAVIAATWLPHALRDYQPDDHRSLKTTDIVLTQDLIPAL